MGRFGSHSFVLCQFSSHFGSFLFVCIPFIFSLILVCFGSFWVILNQLRSHFRFFWRFLALFGLILCQFRSPFGSFWLVLCFFWSCLGLFLVALTCLGLFWISLCLILGRFSLFWGRFACFGLLLLFLGGCVH